MKWYTVHWNDSQQGHCLEHFTKLRDARKRKKTVEDTGEGWLYDGNVEKGIDKNIVSSKTDLVNWLNHFFNKDNG